MATTKIQLPEVQGPIPETKDSQIHGKHGVDHFNYVIQEYFVTGVADTYESVSMSDAMDMTKRDNVKDLGRRNFDRPVIQKEVPYTTRLLIYRPKDDRKFSGNVIIEPFHPIYGGIMATWGNDNFYHMEHGDIQVGVQHPSTFAGIKKFNKDRYAQLNMPDFTQLWGCLAQVGALMKSRDKRNPLLGLAVTYQFMTGLSYTGVATATFANYHHATAKLPDGKNIFDGYVPINNAMYNRPLDVPVIRIMSMGDYASFGGLNNRREDSDVPGSKYRMYELAGAPHTTVWQRRRGMAKFPGTLTMRDMGAPRQLTDRPRFAENEKPNDFPLGIFFAGAFQNLFDWVRGINIPPKGDRIATNADGSTKVDAHGNPVGGIRSPYVDVPIATYNSRELMGYKIPFTVEKKKKLYGSHARYVDKVFQATETLVKERWIPASEASEIIDTAKASEPF
jgi:Alpha/beta hydrolase domain